MKNTAILFFVIVMMGGCDRSGDKNAVVQRENDSISKVEQQKKNDSMKKKNPLLILPPDTDYTGSYVDKYPNGVIKFTGFYRFGERHGQWMSFYPNGLPWSEMHYDKGLRHGPNITYFTNGKKRFEGAYKNDKQDSVWIYYDSTGKIAERVLFKDSRLIKHLSGEKQLK